MMLSAVEVAARHRAGQPTVIFWPPEDRRAQVVVRVHSDIPGYTTLTARVLTDKSVQLDHHLPDATLIEVPE